MTGCSVVMARRPVTTGDVAAGEVTTAVDIGVTTRCGVATRTGDVTTAFDRDGVAVKLWKTGSVRNEF